MMSVHTLITVLSLAAAMPAGTVPYRAESATSENAAVEAPLDTADTLRDSTAAAALRSKLKEYLTALGREPRNIKCSEADFIIEACNDSAVRQETAVAVYRHFLDSKIMGDEAVAIHVYDHWFADGKVKMDSEADLWAAKLFATVNRQSLIGCRAPELQLEKTGGGRSAIFGKGFKGNGRYTILYFYDTECPKCRIESILLRNILENDNLKVNLYAIYAGKDKEKWENYIGEQLEINAPDTEITHFWNPDDESGMDLKYGIIQTPRIFLVAPDGTIIGRGLDVYSLEQMLTGLLAPQEIEYGSDEAMEMFRKAFAPIEKGMGCEGLSLMADHISDSVLDVRDTLLYKQMIGDLLYFVSGQRGENYKCGTTKFIDKYILDRSDIWNTGEDSLKVVGLASLMKDMAELAPVGQKLPDIKIPATKVVRKGKAAYESAGSSVRSADFSKGSRLRQKYGKFSLAKTKDAVIIFHTEGCKVCEAEISAAYSLLESGGIGKLMLIDMDEIFSDSPDLAGTLMETFDLSSLPFILTTDHKSLIVRKYISFCATY